MKQFDFLATWDDSLAMLRSVLQLPGVVLIPDRNYDTVDPIIISQGSHHFDSEFKTPCPVFIWSDVLSEFPPKTSRILEGPAKNKFWICPSDLQPLIDCIFYTEATSNGRRRLSPGTLSMASRWLMKDSGSFEKPNHMAVQLFNDVRKQLTLHLRRIFLHEPAWIGNDAFNRFNRGELSVVDCGREYVKCDSGETIEIVQPRSLP